MLQSTKYLANIIAFSCDLRSALTDKVKQSNSIAGEGVIILEEEETLSTNVLVKW